MERHQGLLRELQKLAVDGKNKFTLTHFGVFLTHFSLLDNIHKSDLVFHLFFWEFNSFVLTHTPALMIAI